MTGRDDVLISADDLMRWLEAGVRPVVLDVRWRLDKPDGYPDYLVGHLPGAVYVSLEDELSDHSVTGRGRHPLPSGSALQEAARRWGVTSDRPVVVYDDWNRAGSARARWVLTASGLTGVRILDGGLPAWTAAGGALETGAATPAAGDVELPHSDLYAGARATVTAQQIRAGAATTLIDARAPERFSGAVEPIDVVAGHIPGAINLPSGSVLDHAGRFRAPGDIGALLTDRTATGPIGVYCGSGVTAAVVIAALETAGIDAALFPGSWSQWSSEPGCPVERG